MAPVLLDGLVKDSWPKFLHPWPLNDKYFRVPANTPISVQPLDAEGKALQLMRSWFVGMPGEQVSCVGCHQRQNRAPGNRPTIALSKSVSDVALWYGPPRGFSFDREVQPVLDKYCLRCHNGKPQRDEQPPHRVQFGEPFWIGQFEVTNAQYNLFDPAHDSRLEHGDFLQFSHQERGYPLNTPQQPVARVWWYDAVAFCDWLTARTGRRFALPTEAQWEYACRAGTQSPWSFEGVLGDFSRHANLADARFKRVDSFQPWQLPFGAIPPWRPADDRCNDGFRVSAPVGSFKPNGWGLADMHGNVAV